jgi:hypothetical protein
MHIVTGIFLRDRLFVCVDGWGDRGWGESPDGTSADVASSSEVSTLYLFSCLARVCM